MRERWVPRELQSLHAGPLHWHEHPSPYAALVLDGGYLERGDEGVLVGEPGDLVVHMAFERHANAIGRSGAQVFNIPLTLSEAIMLRSGRLDDPVAAMKELRRGLPLASLTTAPCVQSDDTATDEADVLASMLRAGRDGSLEVSARAIGVPPRTLRRQFGALYGMSAAQFRARARARRAWKVIVATHEPLATVAAEQGFADQAHMTRSVRALTGWPPSWWRRLGRLVQDTEAICGHFCTHADPALDRPCARRGVA